MITTAVSITNYEMREFSWQETGIGFEHCMGMGM